MPETRQHLVVLVDLDRTLYPPETSLQEAGDRLLNEWMAHRLDLSLPQVDDLRRRLWAEYGTSARGLQVEYGISQAEVYSNTIERLDPADYVWPRPQVRQMLSSLHIPVYVCTNSTQLYCERVLAALGLEESFTGIITIETMRWQAKPHEEAYWAALRVAGVEAEEAIFVDDAVRNLEGARLVGLRAVLCHPHPRGRWSPHIPDIVELPDVLAVLARKA
jgi:putative hydrolase of the HAD superfamily